MKERRVFWSRVEAVSEKEGDWRITLDQQPVTLPAGTILTVSSHVLAKKIAEEWQGCIRNTPFEPDQLPITQLVATQLERVAPRRNEVVAQMTRIFLSDALFYRHGNDALGREQEKFFAMPRSVFEEAFRCILPWEIEIAPIDIAHDIVQRIEAKLRDCDDVTLTCLFVLASMTASLILSYAILKLKITIDAAVYCAFAERNAQIARWGRDPYHDVEQEACRSDIKHVLDFYALSAVVDAA